MLVASNKPKVSGRIRWLAVSVFFITALTGARIDFGPLPIYLVDGFIAVALILVLRNPRIPMRTIQPIYLFSAIYFCTIIVSEINGAFSYGLVLEPIYMIVRYGLGISLVIILPRLIAKPFEFLIILKAALAGLLVTSLITILSSLPPTRPLVMDTVFSWNILAPSMSARGLERQIMLWGEDAALRGNSLVGSANMTGGFLCTLLPIAFIAYRSFKHERRWRSIALLACVFAPLGAFATYSRAAWFGVGLIVIVVGFLGYLKGRHLLIFVCLVGILLIFATDIPRQWFFFEHIGRRTQSMLTDPLESRGDRERFLSYYEPFQHFIENPSWLFVGAGCAGNKMMGRGELDDLVFDLEERATHSAFSMAYYNFGMVGAVCHITLMVFAFALILKNMRRTRYHKEEHFIWQSLLAVWLGMTPWWLFGHSAASIPRGSMFFFLIFGFLLTLEKLRKDKNKQHTSRMSTTRRYRY